MEQHLRKTGWPQSDNIKEIEKHDSKNIQATVEQYSDYNQNNENQENICFLNIKKLHP